MRLWIAAAAVGQVSQKIVSMTGMVESFSSSYLAKCVISSLLENLYNNCEKRRKNKKRKQKRQAK
ncbi:hypothetical protein ES288_D03G167200v1 [Gossypium darwinii]|uniref:Uncharacterized protein n=1 Tax=Gossypium darwinii TaxID=34276 RepID=A0A5D2D7S7_GOSDA|nr:hypothetical protein ES288_D03G167200v1 [Gossypium darwinii]